MQSCEGFFNYQGQTNGPPHHVYLTMDYQSLAANPKAMTAPLFSCCAYPPYLDTAPYWPPPNVTQPNTSCPCASCAGMCNGHQSCAGTAGANASSPLVNTAGPAALNGFSAGLVGFF